MGHALFRGFVQMIPVATESKGFAVVDANALPEADRFAFWSDVICKNFSPSDNTLSGKSAQFTASMSRRMLGQVGISHMHSAPLTSRRDRQSIRRDPMDCFCFSFLTGGQGRIRQGGRETVQRKGDFLIYDAATPFEYDWDSDFSGYWLRLPRQTLLNRLPNAEIMTARSVPVSTAMGRLVGTMVQEAHGLDLCGESPAARRVASSLVDLVATAIETHGGCDVQVPQRHVNLLDKAKSYILTHLEDTALDCDRMVRDLGVSRRTLSRLFAGEGSTPVKWMWKNRLERSREMLQSGGARRVTDVALSCGFSDVSHFSRAFKAEFGSTPRQFLAALH